MRNFGGCPAFNLLSRSAKGLGVTVVRNAWLVGKIVLAVWFSSLLVPPPTTSGQELMPAKPKKEKPPKPDKQDRPQITKEDKIILATAQRTFGAETERDRWLKVMDSHFPGCTQPDARGEVDFAKWFEAVGAGQATWTIQSAREKPVKELFLRASQRLGLSKEPIAREAFLAYAVQNLSAGNSPPWKAPNPEVDPFDAAAKIFTALDRNKNGSLEATEQTDTLKAVVGQFDANGNGALEYDEYREYFRARMSGYRENPAALSAALPQPPTPEEKSETMKIKKDAPPSLPKWYVELDDDRDGQVGLYEWRSIGQRPLEEFAAVDRDGDGLLTPYELKCLSKSEPKSPYLKASLPSIPSQYLKRSWR